MTLLVASILVRELDSLRDQCEQAFAEGADAVELRIDTYAGASAELADFLRSQPHRRFIVTCRSADEGGHCTDEAPARASRLIEAVGSSDAWIDFEWADWQRSDRVRSLLQSVVARGEAKTGRLILSAHDFEKVPGDLADRFARMQSAPCAAAKIAFRAEDIVDNFQAFDLMRQYADRAIVVAMGEAGLASRVLAQKFGAYATYAGLSEEAATAPGQLTVGEMTDFYRFGKIDAATDFFGVLGDPVAHSMSPLLFNRWFAESGTNAVYLPLHVARERDTLGRFLDGCRKRPWLSARGFSVTIPHKEAALKWVGDGVESAARKIGAVNTIVMRDGGITGHNTDAPAAIASLAAALGSSPVEMKGLPVDVLGSGGSARAIVAGLTDCGCRVSIFGRNPDKARALASRFDAQAHDWSDRAEGQGKVLIHCTSVGMWPAIDESPMEANGLDGYQLVFDIIYNPLATKLLVDAKARGASTLNGLDMFVRQAAMQHELWLGGKPDLSIAAELVASKIKPFSETAT